MGENNASNVTIHIPDDPIIAAKLGAIIGNLGVAADQIRIDPEEAIGKGMEMSFVLPKSLETAHRLAQAEAELSKMGIRDQIQVVFSDIGSAASEETGKSHQRASAFAGSLTDPEAKAMGAKAMVVERLRWPTTPGARGRGR